MAAERERAGWFTELAFGSHDPPRANDFSIESIANINHHPLYCLAAHWPRHWVALCPRLHARGTASSSVRRVQVCELSLTLDSEPPVAVQRQWWLTASCTPDRIPHLAFARDGLHLVASGFDGVLLVWDLSSCVDQDVELELPPVLSVQLPDEPRPTIWAAIFNPDPAHLAVVAQNKLIALHTRLHATDGHAELDGETAAQLQHLISDEADLIDVLHPPIMRDDAVAAPYAVAQVNGMNASDGTFPMASTYMVAVNYDCSLLATGSYDHHLKLWDAETFQLVRVLVDQQLDPPGAHAAPVRALAFDLGARRESSCLASGSWDMSVKLWDTETGALLLTIAEHSHCVLDMHWSPCSRYLASAAQDMNAFVFDTVTGEVVKRLMGASPLSGIAWVSSNVVVTSTASGAYLWHVKEAGRWREGVLAFLMGVARPRGSAPLGGTSFARNAIFDINVIGVVVSLLSGYETSRFGRAKSMNIV